MDEHYPDKNITFKVNARRARKNYPVESMEINASVGEKILQAFPEIRVDVHNPDVMLYIEVREHIYIYSIEIPGPGGMPVGTNGKAMLLLSGGIDSPVAGFMVAKRGVKIDAGLFPCASVHQRARKAEGCRSCKAGSTLQRTDLSACHQFYGDSAGDL